MGLLERQKEFTRYLVAGFPELGLRGLPFKSACAITGNASQESLVRPVTGPVDHGSDGTLQWRLDRLDGPNGLRGWAQENGLPWNTLKTQAAFTLWELEKDYANRPAGAPLLAELRAGSRPIETLTANFCKIYERPNMALAHLDKRISHAKSVYKIMEPEFKTSTEVKVGTGAIVVAGGATAVATGDYAQGIAVMVLSVVAAAITWYVNRPKPSEAPELSEASIEPIAIEASPTANLDAAREEALRAFAKLIEEQKKVQEKIKEYQDAVTAAGVVIEQAKRTLPVVIDGGGNVAK